jgi:hypothetical protein
LSYFENPSPGRPVGEIDPNYFGISEACDRIGETIPHCRIVVSLRDPTARAWSSYRTMHRDAWTRLGFEETVAQNEVIRESSRYAYHLDRWRSRFGIDRVLVMLYDDLEASAQSYLDRICDFIDAPRLAIQGTVLADERVNAVTHAPRSRRAARNARNARDWMRAHRWHRTIALLERAGIWKRLFGGGEEFGAMDPETEARLREHFRPEVEALEQMLGRDLSHWKNGNAPSKASGTTPEIGRRASA